MASVILGQSGPDDQPRLSRRAFDAVFPDLDHATEVGWALERLRRRTLVVESCWLWQGYTKNGYPAISIRNEDVYGHRLVCAFVHGLADEMDACHSCDHRRCWNPDHLFAGTRLQNILDARSKGRMPNPPRVAGESHPKATLTDMEVAEIRQAHGVPQRDLADAFGCSQSTVWRIRHRKVRV